MRLTWYGHSCFKLDTEDGSVVFDPYAPGSVPGLTLPEITADAVICSHGHGDHNYAEGVQLTGIAPRFEVFQIDCFHDEVQGLKRGKNRITVLDTEGLRAVHMGDIGHMPDKAALDKLCHADLLMIPVGGYYTIDAKTAHALVSLIRPRVTVPMHYRGKGFGYDVISTADEFLKLSGDVKVIEASGFELSAETPPMTVLLKSFVQ